MMLCVNLRSSLRVARQASAAFARSHGLHCPCCFSSGASTLAPATVFQFLCPLSRGGLRKALTPGFRTQLRKQERTVAAGGVAFSRSAKLAARSGRLKERLRRVGGDPTSFRKSAGGIGELCGLARRV